MVQGILRTLVQILIVVLVWKERGEQFDIILLDWTYLLGIQTRSAKIQRATPNPHTAGTQPSIRQDSLIFFEPLFQDYRVYRGQIISRVPCLAILAMGRSVSWSGAVNAVVKSSSVTFFHLALAQRCKSRALSFSTGSFLNTMHFVTLQFQNFDRRNQNSRLIHFKTNTFSFSNSFRIEH